MKMKIIRLVAQSSGDSKPQPYNGDQIVELVGLAVVGDKPAMVCMVDPTRKQACDQFVLREDQAYDPAAKSPGGESVNDQPPKVLGMVKTSRGYVTVTSYCFA